MSAPPSGQLALRQGTDLPARVLDIEMSVPVTAISRWDEDGRSYAEAWCLVRIFDEPVGYIRLPFGAAPSIDVDQIMHAVREQCSATIIARVEEAGADADAVLRGRGATTLTVPPFLHRHRQWSASGPAMTVAICTRNRPADLARTLDSLRGQSYRNFTTLVVDNAPSDDATRSLVSSRSPHERIAYAVEERPGLSFARNRALDLVTTPVTAWLDDDELADRHWLMEAAAAYCTYPGAAAVTGVVVPAEVRTLPQLWFEQFGGHSKGRGFTPDVFSLGDLRGQSALYPLPPFGVGANMSFDTEQLRAIGGFDPALGAGTLTQGGEDTLAFTQLLLGGGSIVYQPTSITRHYHRVDYDALARQMRGYGVGLTAFYSSLLRTDWRLLPALVRLAPRALRDTARGGNARAVPESFPAELLRIKTRGMLAGPLLYARARRAVARQR